MPTKTPGLSVGRLAQLLGCSFRGDGETEITGVGSLEKAGKGDLVFLSQKKFRHLLETTAASAAIIPPGETFNRIPTLISENPHRTFIEAIGILVPASPPVPGIHPTAWISPAARIGQNVSIGAFSYIGEDVEIGDNVVIHPLVSVYPEARIGERTILHSHVSIREGVRLGKGVIVHNGAVIGSDGFGYLKLEDGTHLKIPQLGSVIVEDNVEIGANTAVDRAALDETMIGKGTKIDNLIQIAHNVEIGRNGILAAQTGIAGSSKIGHNVVMGGQVGIPDHITIGDNVIVMAQAGVTKDLPDGSIVVGSPHMKVRDFWKMWAALGQLYDLIRDFKALQKKIEELEKRLK